MNKDKTVIEKPIFIFGCPNSGTTILWEAMKSHEGVSGPDIEGQDLEGMPRQMRHYMGNSTFRLWAHYLFAQGEEIVPGSNLTYYVTENNWTEDAETQLRQAYENHFDPETRLCDKSPAHALRARFLQRCFPDADFVAIVRDGYAVSEGIRRKREFDPDRPKYRGLRTRIEDAAYQWNKSNEIIASYEELRFLDRLLTIKYEDLVQNTEETLHRVLNFCGLDKCDFRIPVFSAGKNEEQIARLSAYEIEVISEIATPMLRRFGYDVR